MRNVFFFFFFFNFLFKNKKIKKNEFFKICTVYHKLESLMVCPFWWYTFTFFCSVEWDTLLHLINISGYFKLKILNLSWSMRKRFGRINDLKYYHNILIDDIKFGFDFKITLMEQARIISFFHRKKCFLIQGSLSNWKMELSISRV